MQHPSRHLPRAFLSHLGRQEVAEAIALCAPDATAHLPENQVLTIPELREFFTLTFERVVRHSWVLEVLGTTSEAQRVAIEARSSAVLRDGTSYSNRYHFLFIVRDRAIQSFDVYASGELILPAVWATQRLRHHHRQPHLRVISGRRS